MGDRISIPNGANVALEVANVDWIESDLMTSEKSIREYKGDRIPSLMTYECHPKSHIGFSECIADEVVFPVKDLLHFIKCVEHFNYSFLVCCLGGSEA